MLRHNQRGVGLIEVMVALLVLAIGVLGYSAMQTRALTSSDDALLRTKAISIITELTERMRNNDIDPATMIKYKEAVNASSLPTELDCTNGCSSTSVAVNDVYYLRSQAEGLGINLSMDSCPGTVSGLTRDCIIAAWGETTAAFGGLGKCMTTEGQYTQGSQCIVMEAY